MVSIGIDLGTTNTLVALLNAHNEPEIQRIDNSPLIPSVICIEEPAGVPLVGQAALDLWKESDCEGVHCLRRWKLKMGQACTLGTMYAGAEHTDPMPITPEYLTTCMVEYVLTQLSKGLGGRAFDSVLVTVPHGWRRTNPEKCKATRRAAAEARIEGQPVEVQEATVSEPVAAAAYWLWEMRQANANETLDGKTLLVCDIGGGTFDLSLVLVGAPERPLNVIDALNHDYAGDYADALLCAWVCRQFNQKYATDYPATAEQILASLHGHDYPWLRDWFWQANALKQTLSLRAEHARRGAIKPAKGRFTDPEDRTVNVSLDADTFQSCLEPFYAQGRALIQQLLDRHRDQLPTAVIPAGGGSRILGLQRHILELALGPYYSAAEREQVLERVQPNRGRFDEAIALGAALIANGAISVQERLLHDIALIADIPAALAKHLNIHPGEAQGAYLPVLLTPVLAQGTPLPTEVTSAEIGVRTSIAREEQLHIRVAILDDPMNPWIQTWTIHHPGEGKQQSVDWTMSADTEGLLTLQLRPRHGQTVAVQGQLERHRIGRASLILGEDFSAYQQIPQVSPKALRQAIQDG